MRRFVIALALLASPAIAHDCDLPPTQFDHAPTPLPIETKVPWWHLAKACGYKDTPPAIPTLFAGGGAEFPDRLARPNACRWREGRHSGLWHIALPEGGGWSDSEVDRCRRFEWGSINGWQHSDPRE